MIKNLLKDKPLPVGAVLEKVGYSQTLSEQPSRIIQSEGFQQALSESGLREALEAEGINPQKIAKKINELLEMEEYQAIDKGITHAIKIHGVIDDTKTPSGNTYNFIFSETVRAKVRTLDEEIKAELIKPKTT